jgi:type II secretory pathway component GspD/PulD (secretin)
VELSTAEQIKYTAGYSQDNLPQTDSVETGMRLKVRPDILPGDEQKVILDINCTITNITGYQEQADNNNQTYKIPIRETIEIQTSATVPDRGTLVLEGPKITPSALEDQKIEKDQKSQRLLLLIKPEIINTH